MFFSRRRYRCLLLCVLLGVVLLGVSVLTGCEENLVKQDDVSKDVANRVETNRLSIIVEESALTLRNLLNILSALPEICSTPLATLGSFVSSLPALGAPVSSILDAEVANGTWKMIWRDIVLGDPTAPSVDLTLTVRFLSGGLGIEQAVPFSLAPLPAFETTGEPAAFADEGFFLFQNENTGEWTLRWQTGLEPRVFEGTINAAVSRVVRRIAPGDNNAVTSLDVNDTSTDIRFRETTEPTDVKGFTFFVRPGEVIRFRLRIGPVRGELQEITSDELRIGPNGAPPPGDNPGDFILASSRLVDPTGNLVDPTGRPALDKVGTFVWQDIGVNNDCQAATEDQWRVRFGIQGSSTTFSGAVIVVEDGQGAQLRASAVGSCPVGSISDGNKHLDYNCVVQDNTESGYDICVTHGRRVTFEPEVNDVRDPGKVFIGSQEAFLPSPYPFNIQFEIELTERQSSHALMFDNAVITLHGNNDQEGAALLNADQVSLDPFCSIPGETKQRLPRVRLSGAGDYSTDRFEGSRYELDDENETDQVLAGIEFTEVIDPNDNPLADARRFPDRGTVRLLTRLAGELENSKVLARMAEITHSNGQTVGPVEVELNISGVAFDFADQVSLSVE